MDENTRKIYEKYGLNPEKREKENLKILENRYKKLDSLYKKMLREEFKKGINENFNRLIKYQRDPRFYCFKELESNIWQVIKCLTLESYSASITLTNHIIERTLKLALIQYDSGIVPKELENWNETYKESNKYSDKSMYDTITECKRLNLINEAQTEQLNNYRRIIRNGFSHFDSDKILAHKDNSINAVFPGNEKVETKTIQLNLKQIPILQNVYVNKFAEENAEKYFDFVFEIIKHIERKFKEKYYLEYLESVNKTE